MQEGVQKTSAAGYRSIRRSVTGRHKTTKKNAVEEQRLKARRNHVKNKIVGNNNSAAFQPKTAGFSSNSSSAKSVKTISRASVASKKKKNAVAQARKARARKQAVQKAAKMTQAAAKKTSMVVKKVAVAVGKAVAAAGKGIAALVAAGGPVLILIMAIVLVAAILASAVGIFFSSEDNSPGTVTVRQVVQETTQEFSQEIETIIANNAHDELVVHYATSGYLRADNWIDILTIFAVETTTAEDGMDVLTLDATRAQLLKDTFWKMVSIGQEVQVSIEEIAILDEDGNDTGETETVEHKTLVITITGISAWDYADQHGFTPQQKELVEEMLSGDYDSYFEELLGTASYTGDGTGVVGTGSFIWPSSASDLVSSPFGTRVHPISHEISTHHGIDIPAPHSSEVLAADAGTVTIATFHDSYGFYVEIDHGNGYKTRYAHCSVLNVAVGDTVNQGDVIAQVGSTGVSTGPHIHFEVFENGVRKDPLGFFNNYTTEW
ncbi:peptidoglycan DD-metalloendopeptidase family protein [Ruminococcaceae bacterium OttesenSCG-928-A16]|nr:peptidoglycan DD-metalloendopeptidase family protein [Ruminococcaceae bacterium OttesenSCG-928-A16]